MGAGEKQLSLEHVTLQRTTGTAAQHPLLDNLTGLATARDDHRYISLRQAMSAFLERFPQGFYGDKYLKQERNYKVAAHELAVELLGRRVFEHC